ncbi:MAG TPA: hypothetical protein VMV10_16770 [Pirellulales bacterium]|nr:hypothetical protein [Pirellulales bacterium]
MTLRRIPRRSTRAWLIAWACLAACFPSPLLAAQPAGFDINVIDREIARAMRDNVKLHGAWLFVELENSPDAAAPDKYLFRRVLDRGRAATQREELDGLIRAWSPQGGYRVDAEQDREYPFSELMAELRLAVETEPRLGGCMIADGYYAADANDPSKLNLMLRGRIAKEGQDVEIEALCGRLMRAEPAWVKAAAADGSAENPPAADFVPLAISPKSAELKVVEPSEANGRWFYGVGMNRFWRGDYAAAAQAFRQAALESPRKLQYHYWWVLADLAQGDAALARRRMATAVERFRDADFDRQSPEYLAVVRSLERVQGRLRRQLLKLETEALLRDSRAGND